ncbi:MAG TPA: hypothetical protein VM429_07770, partial [Micropruina sp.]|nr:hypothetical protein [Micropruina sp.]
MSGRRAIGRRAFGEISRLPSGRFRARYTGPDLVRHSAPVTFVTRIDAEGWLADQERRISRGEWTAPTRHVVVPERPVLFGDFAVQVLAGRRLRPATIALYAKLLRLAILPTFGALPVAEITAGQVTAWYATQKSTPTQQANAYGLLKSILAEAVVDGLIPANPCRVKAGGQKHRAREIDVSPQTAGRSRWRDRRGGRAERG